MSAWIVSKAHIDVLVHALGKRELFPDGKGPDEIGTILWAENYRSVNYRYSESAPTPPYIYAVPPVAWTPGQMFKIVGCFDYQTSEHPDYKVSEASRLVEILEASLEREGAERDDSAPWGIPLCGGNHDYTDCAPCESIRATEEASV